LVTMPMPNNISTTTTATTAAVLIAP